MNLEQLRGFLEVARSGHFTRAAEALHLAQPSLSRQIATLERELGADLFHRARGNISLTAAGETLLPIARRMLADADAVRREMDELAGLRRGRVRLGATPTLCVSIVADAIAAFRAAYPGIELHLVESGSRTLVDELTAGTLDFALVTTSRGVDAASGLELTPLLTEELAVISAHELPASLALDELAELPLIAFAESYDLRAATDAAFERAGLTPRVVLEGAEMDAILRFVERGIGVAVVPATVLVDRPGLRSSRLTDPRLPRTISLARRADVAPTRAAHAMRRMVVDTAEALATRGTFFAPA